jgi:transposase-like protein
MYYSLVYEKKDKQKRPVMQIIISDILTLIQYISMLKTEDISLRPEYCPHCGKANPHRHATYERHADREHTGKYSLNPLTIQRYFCPSCNKTCSVLPECIPPRRWYSWTMQQTILVACLLGNSINQVAQKCLPSRSTCKRWWSWLQFNFNRFSSELRTLFPLLGRENGFSAFWFSCFKQMSLSKAMYFCHQKGVLVP